MKLVSVTAVRNKLVLLVGAFLGGFLLFGGVAWWAMDTVKVGGSYYSRIVESKDLIADVLPPPEYLIESYLVALQLKDATSSPERRELLENLKKLRADYETRRVFWEKSLPASPVRTALLEKSHQAAQRFFEVLDKEYLPEVYNGDTARLGVIANTSLKSAYREHRSAVDNVVVLANERYQHDEATTQGVVHTAWLVLGGISLSVVIITGVLAWRASQGILKEVTHQTRDLERARGELDAAFTRLGEVARLVQQDADRVAATGLQLGRAVSASNKSMETVQGSMNEVAKTVLRVTDLSDSVATGCSDQEASTRVALDALDDMLKAIQSVHEASGHQQSMASSVEQEMGAAAQAVQALSGSAERFASAAGRAANVARSSGSTVAHTVESMRRIEEQMGAFSVKVEELGGKSEEIGGILATITTIARQTNLLALNATIEAARAREHGLGFAVVAEEVRKLAVQVTGATTEIGQLIDGVRSGVTETIAAMVASREEVARGAILGGEAERSLQEILEATDSLMDEVSLVSTTSFQMESSVGKTQEAVSHMLGMISSGEGDIHVMTQQSKRVAESLQELRASGERATLGAVELKTTMHQVTQNTQRVSASLTEQVASISQVGEATHDLSEMAVGLKELAGGLQKETQLPQLPSSASLPLLRAA